MPDEKQKGLPTVKIAFDASGDDIEMVSLDSIKLALKKHHSTYRKTSIEAVIIADIYEDLTGEELKP